MNIWSGIADWHMSGACFPAAAWAVGTDARARAEREH
jgi:hypothetical protein